MRKKRVLFLKRKSGLTPEQWRRMRRRIKKVWNNTPKDVKSYIVERNLWN